MNRDTAMARWYRRVDPHCFTAPSRSDTGSEGARSTNASSAERARTGTTLPIEMPAAITAPSGWRALVNDRRGWAIKAAADRH